MEPENIKLELQEEKENPLKKDNPLTKITPVSKYLALTLFVVLPFLGGWIGYVYAPNQSADTIVVGTQNTPVLDTVPNTVLKNESVSASGVFTSNKKNISFTIPTGWEQIQPSEVTLPQGAETPWFAIEDPATGCVIANGVFTYDFTDTYRQISFADRVFNGADQFDGDWIMPRAQSSAVDVLDERKYLLNEVRVTNGIGDDIFYLWQKNKGSVPDSCNTAMNKLLESSNYYYESLVLDKAKKGTLWIKHDNDNVGGENPRTYLLATLASGETYKVIDLPEGINWYGTLVVIGEKIYGIVNGTEKDNYLSGIVTLDPFTGSVAVVPGTDSEGSYILSLYAHDGLLYYIKGDSSLGGCYEGGCRANLYSTIVTGGEVELVAKDIKDIIAGPILGYSPDENSIYVSSGWGDAGCSSRKISALNLSTKIETVLVDKNACVDEPGYTEMETAVDAVMKKIPQLQTSTMIEFGEGSFIPSKLEQPHTYSRLFLRIREDSWLLLCRQKKSRPPSGFSKWVTAGRVTCNLAQKSLMLPLCSTTICVAS